MSYIVVLGKFEDVIKVKDILKSKFQFKFDWGNKVWFRECLQDKFPFWQKAIEEDGRHNITCCWVESLSKVESLRLAIYEMEQEMKPAVPEVAPSHAYDGMVFEVKRWIANKIKEEQNTAFLFRNFRVLKVKRETAKAFQIDAEFFSGIASTCGICGAELSNDISRATGIGPICAGRMGLDRPSMKNAKEIVAQMEAVSKAQGTFKDVWIPKSQIKYITDPKNVVHNDKNLPEDEAQIVIETDEDQGE